MNNPGAILVTAAALVAAGAVLFWPKRGLYWWSRRFRQAGERVLIEDALKHFHHCEFCGLVATLDSLSGALLISPNRAAELVGRLTDMGLLDTGANRWRLSTEGRRYALRVIRIHRLWERYLAEQTGVPETAWHGDADRREHTLSDEQVEALAAGLGDPRYDPHGAPIPTASGDITTAGGSPLTSLPEGKAALITHVEDEPEGVYAQLVALGLGVGVHVRVFEVTPQRIRLEADGEECVLAPVVAANVSVTEVSPARQVPERSERLSGLQQGEKACIVGISPACLGLQRRRLLDLGFVPGSVVEAELRSPAGDPVAYRVRGALVALRGTQAAFIQVSRGNGGS